MLCSCNSSTATSPRAVSGFRPSSPFQRTRAPNDVRSDTTWSPLLSGSVDSSCSSTSSGSAAVWKLLPARRSSRITRPLCSTVWWIRTRGNSSSPAPSAFGAPANASTKRFQLSCPSGSMSTCTAGSLSRTLSKTKARLNRLSSSKSTISSLNASSGLSLGSLSFTSVNCTVSRNGSKRARPIVRRCALWSATILGANQRVSGSNPTHANSR